MIQVFEGPSDLQAKVPRPMPDDAPVTLAETIRLVGWKHGETRVKCEETTGKMQVVTFPEAKRSKNRL